MFLGFAVMRRTTSAAVRKFASCMKDLLRTATCLCYIEFINIPMHDLSMLKASMLFMTCMSSCLCLVTYMYEHAQLIAEGQNWRECSWKVVGTLTLLRWRSKSTSNPRRMSLIQIEGSQRDSSRKSIIGTMLRAEILTVISCMHKYIYLYIYMYNMHAWTCHSCFTSRTWLRIRGSGQLPMANWSSTRFLVENLLT